MNIQLNRIILNNYKAFKSFSFTLKDMNILVGSNNSGKSTVISSLRLLAYAIKYGCTKNPNIINYKNKKYIYILPEDKLPIPIENVQHDYNDEESYLEFIFSNGATLTLNFPEPRTCYLTTTYQDNEIKSKSKFKEIFAFPILQIPILGPVDSEERKYKEETINNSVGTNRASRHFRNYWLLNNDNFNVFATMVSETWKGMEIEEPEYNMLEDRITMFCKENRISRELYWSGYGFQIWCQLLTHISRSNEYSLLVVDEPDIYLHPELQRELLKLLRSLDCQIVLATHSSEIIAESDPKEIVIIDKHKKSAKRLNDIAGIQQIINDIGSIQNITLTSLAKTRKLVFTEGKKDMRIIKRFAQRLDNEYVASKLNLTIAESDGFSSWENIRAFSWGFNKAFGEHLAIGAIFDRDYWCNEEIHEINDKLKSSLDFSFFHEVKEVENYLLNSTVIERLLIKLIDKKNQTCEEIIIYQYDCINYLNGLCDDLYPNIISQCLSKYNNYHKNILGASGKRDMSTLNKEALKILASKWTTLDEKLKLVPGKEVLRKFRSYIQEEYGISISDYQIIDNFKINEIDKGIISIINTLESF